MVIKNLFLGTAHSLAGTLSCGRAQNNMFSLSSAEVGYLAMMHASSKMLWVRSFLDELSFPIRGVMPMYCDSQATIFLANSPTFHERSKHI